MKKTLSFFAYIMMMVLIITPGCELFNTAEETLELSRYDLEFDWAESKATIHIIATSKWSASITEGEEWLSLNQMEGEGSLEVQSLKVSVSENNEEGIRNGAITFTMEGDQPQTLIVEQEACSNTSLSVSTDCLNFGYDSSTETISLSSILKWSVSIDSDIDWIVVTPENNNGSKEKQDINISVVTNVQGERSGTVRFTNGAYTKEIVINQAGPLVPGQYFIGVNHESRHLVARDLKRHYGYLVCEPSLSTDDYIGYEDDIFTLSYAEGGYTIQDSNGNYLCATSSYRIYYSSILPEEAGVWQIRVNSDGSHIITNSHYGYNLQYFQNNNLLGVYYLSGKPEIYPTLKGVEVTADRPNNEVAISTVLNGIDDDFYECTGYVTSILNTTYGNFYLKDSTGEVFVYGTLDANGNTRNFISLDISVGDIVTVYGPKGTYGTTVEIVDASVLNINKVTDISIADFLNEEVSDKYYRLTGSITSITNTTWGNFYLTDNSGATVYVYGLLPGWNGPSKHFSELNLKVGDEVTIVGNRYIHNSTDEVMNAFYVSHNSR